MSFMVDVGANIAEMILGDINWGEVSGKLGEFLSSLELGFEIPGTSAVGEILAARSFSIGEFQLFIYFK